MRRRSAFVMLMNLIIRFRRCESLNARLRNLAASVFVMFAFICQTTAFAAELDTSNWMFKKSDIPDAPSGWKLDQTTIDAGFVALTEQENSGSDISCSLRREKFSEDTKEIVGTLKSPEIDLSAYKGKTFELSAFVRSTVPKNMPKDTGGWIVVRKNYLHGNDNSSFGCADDNKWHEVREPITIDRDSTKLTIELNLLGTGQAWIKGVKIKETLSNQGELPVSVSPRNMDFSEGGIGNCIEGWSMNQRRGVVCVDFSTVELPGVGRCGELRSISEHSNDRGSLFQRISAAQFKGKHLVFEADVKFEQIGKGNLDAVRLFLSPNAILDGPFDKRQRQLVTGSQWSHYRVEADLDDKTSVIDFGVELLGTGKVWIRKASLYSTGKSGEGNFAAAELNAKEQRFLDALARVFGFVRFFDVSNERSESWWNQYAVWSVEEMLARANRDEDLASSLSKVISAVNSRIRIGKQVPITENRSIEQNLQWEHHGYGVEPGAVNAGFLSAIRDTAESSRVNSKHDAVFPLIEGLSCTIPMYTENSVGIANQDSKLAIKSQRLGDTKQIVTHWTPNGDDRASRLAAVIVAWNAYRHFYPYSDLEAIDWEKNLNDALKNASSRSGKVPFLQTLRELSASIRDNQARVFCDDIEGQGMISTLYTPTLSFRFVGNEALLEDPKREFSKVLLHGRFEQNFLAQRVTSIMGRSFQTAPDMVTDRSATDLAVSADPVELDKCLSTMEKSISAATPQWLRYRAAQLLLAGPHYSGFCFENKESPESKTRSEVPRTVPFVTTVGPNGISNSHLLGRRPPTVSFINPEILYIDLTRVSASALRKAIVDARHARGIVFDCRGELRLPVQSFLANLIDSPIPSPQFQLPVITEPNYQNVKYDSVGFVCKPQSPKLRAKAIFLADESSVGNAETCLMMVKSAGIGVIAGKATSGTAGGIALAELPANYFISWTQVRTSTPSGTRFHGIGVKPDRDVELTAQAILDGRDEIMEAALAELKGISQK